MARVSIYVPDTMKARMDVFGDRVNWSSVAQQAFELDLARRIEPGDGDMDSVIERLRASKTEYENSEKERGMTEGKDWAMHHASFHDLRKMAKIAGEEYQENLAQDVNKAFGVETMDEDAWFFDVDTREFESDEYVSAFLSGAVTIWDVARRKL